MSREHLDAAALALVTAEKRELAQTLVDAINAKHREHIANDHVLMDAVDRKLRLCREVGQLLQEAQATFRNRFDELVGNFLGFNQRALRSYVVIAKREPKALQRDFKSKWQALREAAEPSELIRVGDGHGAQRLHAPNFFSVASKQLMSLIAGFRKYTAARPLHDWNEETLEQFAAELRPVVNIYGECQKRLAALRR